MGVGLAERLQIGRFMILANFRPMLFRQVRRRIKSDVRRATQR